MEKANKDEIYDLYEKIADWFDNNRSKELKEINYFNIVLDNLPKNGTILDLGCGTGEPIAKFFIEKGYKVVGIDGSKKMINYCQKRFPEMTWIVGGMRTLNLSQQFDAVIAWGSMFLHLVADEQRAMFKTLKSYCKIGGIVLFTSGPEDGEVYGTMDGYEFYHASLDPKEYKQLLEQYGFNIIKSKVADPDCGQQTIWVAKKIQE